MADNKENVTRSMDMFNSAADRIWDMWITGLNSINTNADQIDSITRSQLDMARSARQEFLKQMEEMAKQMRQNQTQLMKFMEDSMLTGFDQFNQTTQSLTKDITQKVEELSKK